MSDEYTYENAGFDSFLSRSIDRTPQVNLSDPGPVSTAVAFDRTQASGMLGNTLQIGNINLDGVKGRISILDSSGNETVRIGELDD